MNTRLVRVACGFTFTALTLGVLSGCDENETGISTGSTAFEGVAGTYNGTATLTANAPGLDVNNETRTESVVIVVEQNGKVTVTLDGRSASRYINAQQIDMIMPVEDTYEGHECKGTVHLKASISESKGTIEGTVGGEGECNKSNNISPVTFDGSLTARK